MSRIISLADAYAAEQQDWGSGSERTRIARAALAAEVSELEMKYDQMTQVASDLSIGCARLQGERDALRAENERLSDHMAELRNLHTQRINALRAECEDHRKQLRKEQLYVQTLADELEADAPKPHKFYDGNGNFLYEIAPSKNEFNPDWDQQRTLLERIQDLEKLVVKLHAAKGRYHTQLAACDLFDAVGLKNERPVK